MPDAGRCLIGIDTGGTFIDIVVCAPDGRMRFHKELADPSDLPASVMRGIAGVAAAAGLSAAALLADAALIAHGTTLATNAVLTRTGAPTALLTTEGLIDALEMRRGVKEEVFDLHYRAPEPLVPRARRIGVEERLRHDGTVLKPLQPSCALERLGRLVEAGAVRAVALCLMHAWADAAHERALAAEIAARWPGLELVASHQVLAKAGFYDRASTTAMTAYTLPLVRDYLGALERRLADQGFSGELFVITSSGGLMTARDAVRQAGRTVLSGPAAAPAMGAKLCRAAGLADAIVVDMGGTSFDVSLVRDGAAVQAAGGEIGGLRIAFPVVDVRTIPLGGGSIASLDAGGLVRLGPGSAGADPGPACFGRGGIEPTITDADLVLGYLDPARFGRSGLAVDRSLAERALTRRLGAAAGPTPVAAASGIYRLAATRMAEAVERAALDAGLDYRAVPLIVGGGAGPLHACAIGRELGSRMIIVPAAAATLCAVGALFLRPHYDAAVSLFRRLGDTSAAVIGGACHTLAASVSADLRRPSEELDLSFAADLRYAGQEDEIAVTFSPERLDPGLAELRDDFETLHRRRRGFALEGEEVEILAVRIVASWATAMPEPRPEIAAEQTARTRTRQAFDVRLNAMRAFAVHDWDGLRPGARIAAPALIELTGTTCVLTEPYEAMIDPERNVVLTRPA